MKSDGTIWIDTKIDESGMEDGFNRLRDGADDVAVSFRNAGKVIEKSFSNINFNKTIENLKMQIRSLEAEFDAVSREFSDALKIGDDKAAEKLGEKRTRIYDRLARARDKLAVEVAAAAQKEAAAEEKASQRIIAAEEQETKKRRNLNNEIVKAGDSASYFGNRLRGIVTSAFIFNIISSGLRKVTAYFGSAMMANDQFAAAVYRVQGSLMVAFQPIYESVLPAIITLINWLNVAVQAVARFFAILAGKSYKQMQSNASSLNSSMGNIGSSAGSAGDSIGDMGDSIEDAGDKAKKAQKYLAGFDEINKMLNEDAYKASENLGAGSIGMDNFKGPVFDEIELPSEWNTAIDKLAMRFKDIFFEWENMTPEIITEKLLTALTTIAGGLIGFALGGPGGAIIGMVIGAGLGVVLSSVIFDGDGTLSTQELLQSIIAALGVIAGGLLGFAIGGPGGALIGVTLGAGLTFALKNAVFDNDGSLTYEELEKSLLTVLLTIGGAGIGFALGGPVGAVIGLSVGTALTFILTKSDITAQEGAITTEQFLNELLEILLIFGGTAVGFFLGGMAGGPAGAAIGAVVGLALSFALSQVSFQPVETEYDNLNKKVGTWSRNTAKTTETDFLNPVRSGFTQLTGHTAREMDALNKDVVANMDLAATGTDMTFFKPVAQWSTKLWENISKDNKTTSERIIENMERAARQTESGYIIPTQQQFETTANWIAEKFTAARDKIQGIWIKVPGWFQMNVTEPMINFFNSLTGTIVNGFNKTAQSVSNAIADLMDAFSSILSYVNGQVAKFSSRASSRTSTTSAASTAAVAMPAAAYPTYPVMDIPMLARGAVIPPNHKFLAVLGDQRSGTNVEAPLSTIQEAVAIVMEDMIQSNLAGHEATVSLLQQILEAVLGIELDGETLSRAINNYNRKMNAARGGLT